MARHHGFSSRRAGWRCGHGREEGSARPAHGLGVVPPATRSAGRPVVAATIAPAGRAQQRREPAVEGADHRPASPSSNWFGINFGAACAAPAPFKFRAQSASCSSCAARLWANCSSHFCRRWRISPAASCEGDGEDFHAARSHPAARAACARPASRVLACARAGLRRRRCGPGRRWQWRRRPCARHGLSPGGPWAVAASCIPGNPPLRHRPRTAQNSAHTVLTQQAAARSGDAGHIARMPPMRRCTTSFLFVQASRRACPRWI